MSSTATPAAASTPRGLTPEQLARAMRLRSEGMPASWIAEDLDKSRMTLIRAGMPTDRAALAAWASVWTAIRRSPALLALHHEFAPPRRFSA